MVKTRRLKTVVTDGEYPSHLKMERESRHQSTMSLSQENMSKLVISHQSIAAGSESTNVLSVLSVTHRSGMSYSKQAGTKGAQHLI